ncbi:MAG: alpha-L-fucosidase [Caulobacteraceae bacterium]|nr:alpha-L-fucosidase [Caulobacteraceae bacterium]
MADQTYAPTLASLNSRPPPAWYDEAKFGIFVHWGLFAIPAFASGRGSISDAFKTDYDRAVAMTPYTEWYANAIKVAGTPSAEFHRRTYGEAPYEAFKAPFLAGIRDWDPAAWAEAFRDAGARYVVLVTKHHDGFCLWPSAVRNPRRPGWDSGRDIVGEAAKAVRDAGLRFGVYYSGGIDWSFNPEPLRTLADFMGSTPGGAYPAYAEAQARELVARYEPSVLWNDISWPTGQDRLWRLFADYYNTMPEGVVNDRWVCASLASKALRLKPARAALDARIKAHIAKNPAAFEGIIPQEVPHSDFRTPEYARFPDIQAKKWEATRGMSHSFGFNRNDQAADYAPAETLIGDFIDGVSKNGNLLLNVGPMADGTIPTPQLDRLKAFGAWLRANGAAIYGSRPWTRAEAVTDAGLPVRFTEAADGALNLIVLGSPAGEALRIKGLALAGPARRLDGDVPASVHAEGEDSLITFARPLTGAFAPTIRVAAAD